MCWRSQSLGYERLVYRFGAQPQASQDPARRLLVFATHCDLLDEHGQRVPSAALRPFQNALQARDAAWFGFLMPHCAQLWARKDDLGREQCRLLVEQMLLQLWDEAGREPLSPLDTRLQELVEAVRREPGRAWTIEEMARRTHLSPSQMARRVRALTSRSPSRLVIEARLNRARQLLLETDMTLAQIAHALGYRDAFYFSRQWKQFHGSSPGSLRKR